ncbi:MAG: DUF3054 domain-containing protein [Caldilineaceae bacterium]|nr:DUF3054 domain-containing protein [Caldilineaceae bacterium]
MSPSPQPVAGPIGHGKSIAVLLLGDVFMLLVFVVIGRISHGFANDWLINVARIVTPFLIGWAIAALLLGLYHPRLWVTPTAFLARSAAGIVIADGLAFLLRSLLMQDRVTLPFALTSVAFTMLFVLSWRLLFLVLHRWRQGSPVSPLPNR